MNERLTELLRKPWVIPTAVGVTSAAVGFASGYILGKRNGDVFEIVEDKEEQLLLDFNQRYPTSLDEDQEKHEELVNDYNMSVELDEEDTNVIVMPERRDPREIIVGHQPNVVPPDSRHPSIVSSSAADRGEPAKVNIFTSPNEDWDYEAELSTRTPAKPYIIHRDEYFGDEMGYGQSTLTYYEGDEILVDETEIPIARHDRVVGDIRFGHGSEDPNVVYIRNEKMNAEWEIIRDSGSYAVEVLGHDVEDRMESADLKHSRSVPKFRHE